MPAATQEKRGRGRPTNASKGLPTARPAAAPALKELQTQLKHTQKLLSRYDSAGQGKRMVGWNAPGTGPQSSKAGLQTIRNRSRDTTRNDWSAESGLQKWTTSLIGVGITPRFKRITNIKRKQVITDLWNDWCEVCDADGVSDFYGMQTLAVRAWLESGEVFVRLRPRDDGLPLPLPLQIQLLEADFVPLFDADTFTDLPAGNFIRSGIEFNNFGRRIAYWIYKSHPGDPAQGTATGGNATPTRDQLVRVAASQISHIFEPKRPGDIRGVSAIAAVMSKLRDAADYEDAVLLRQKLSNLYMAFIKYVNPPTEGNDVDPLSGQPLAALNTEALMPMAPGIIQELDQGQDVTFSNPSEAGTTYSEYLRTTYLGVSAGWGIPYELFSGDTLNVSDRTLRIIINDFRRFNEQRQWQTIIPKFCKFIMTAVAETAGISGAIQIREVDPMRRAEWAPHGWTYIHPVQDPQGKALEVASGFRSRSSVIAERGDDPDQVDLERQGDQQRAARLDLPATPAVVATAASSKKPDPNEEDPTQQ